MNERHDNEENWFDAPLGWLDVVCITIILVALIWAANWVF
jgi:hypothetical protein